MDGSDRAYKLIQAFMQLHRLRMNMAPAIGGIKPSEMRVLKSIQKLDEGQGVMVSELSSWMKVSAPSITQTVNGLVKQGYADRNVDPSDRRAVRLKVTAAGDKILLRMGQEFTKMYSGLVQHLGEESSDILIVLLQQVYEYESTYYGGNKNG